MSCSLAFRVVRPTVSALVTPVITQKTSLWLHGPQHPQVLFKLQLLLKEALLYSTSSPGILHQLYNIPLQQKYAFVSWRRPCSSPGYSHRRQEMQPSPVPKLWLVIKDVIGAYERAVIGGNGSCASTGLWLVYYQGALTPFCVYNIYIECIHI